MRKISYFLGLVLIAAGLVLAIPAFLQWIDFIFSFNSFNSFNLPDWNKAKSIFIQFAIGSFLVNGGWWLLKITHGNKPSTENRYEYIDNKRIQTKNMSSERNIYLGSGNYNERIERDYVQGNKYMGGERQTLAQTAAEIQALLQQLEQSHPTKTTFDRMLVAAKAVETIESNPTLKQRAISAVKEGGLAAFEKAIDNPAGAFIVNAIKGWQEVQ